MNDLQQARKLLEDKINLTNSLIARKKKDFDYHTKEADEIQLAIEALIVEKWKDQESLKAVNEEISRIPTLDYQAKEPMATRVIDEVIKSSFRTLITILILLIPVFSFAQGFIGIEATNHGVGMNGGYMLNTIQLQAGFFSPITNDANKPFVGYASAGYQISINDFSILPTVGIARFGTRDFSKYDGGIEVNKTTLLTSLEIGKEAVSIGGIQFRYYLFVDHAVKTFVGVGLKFFITSK